MPRRARRSTLGFDLIDDGITSFGLQGDDFVDRYAVITYTVTNQQGEDVTDQLQSLEPARIYRADVDARRQ